MGIATAHEPVTLTPQDAIDADRKILDVQYEAVKKNVKASRPAALSPKDRSSLNKIREFVTTQSLLQSTRKAEKASAEIQKKKIENSPVYLKLKRDLEAQKAVRQTSEKLSVQVPVPARDNPPQRAATPKPESREEIVIDGTDVPNEIEFPDQLKD